MPLAGMTIGVFGDIGDTINSTVTLGHLAANSPQVILNVGDLVSITMLQRRKPSPPLLLH